MPAPLLVADSGPLIALARLDLLRLPSAIFAGTLVTATVWDEVLRQPPRLEQVALQAALAKGLLRVVADPSSWPQWLTDARLDAGERSAITLALDLHATVLVDERIGRAAAKSVGLEVIGTLGVLVSAKLAGLVGEVRPLAQALLDSGYFMAPQLVEAALASIGE
jgi:predicted nucleic acid-binding protein